MKLSFRTDHPPTAGHYVVHLGDQVVPDLTAAQVAELLESEKNADAKVFRIRHVHSDGRMELIGVSSERFQLEDGLFFWRASGDAARTDFLELARRADHSPPPCRAKLQLADMAGLSHPHCTALIFPAEFTDEISAWLTSLGYDAGDRADGGISQVSSFYAATPTIIQRRQLWGTLDDSLNANERSAAGA